jgi:hypothetical protein
MERQEGVAGVHAAAKQRLHAQGGRDLLALGDNVGELSFGGFALRGVILEFGHLLHDLGVFHNLGKLVEWLDEGALRRRLVDYLLCAGLVEPEIRLGGGGL